ncbi:MAG: hypothetical protein IT289_08050 [Oligoflexia bacterium]|nr:hypothetical protein [Oligoflexia bacterium]
MRNTIQKIAEATGLPVEIMSEELLELFKRKGINLDEANMDDVRKVFSEYLREVILSAKDRFEDGVLIEEEITPEQLGD